MTELISWKMVFDCRVILLFTVFLIVLMSTGDGDLEVNVGAKPLAAEDSRLADHDHVKRSAVKKKSTNSKVEKTNVLNKNKKISKKQQKKNNKKDKFKMNRKAGGKKERNKKRKPKNKKKKKKGTKKIQKGGGKQKQKPKSGKGPTSRAKADNEIFEGPYGYEHPEAIDWTLPQYRCPDCEDTLIIYDPWYAPPPTLHIPVFCSSNLSEFAKSNSFNNFGPNLTFIFIPGTLNCSDPAKARSINSKQFSIEISERDSEEDTTEAETQQEESSYYDCGKSVTQDMSYLSCGEEQPVYATDDTSRKCFWHFHAYEHWRRQLKFPSWSLPSCADNSTNGDCCKAGPHLLISKTGYAKKFQAYCGPEAPKFDKSDFDKGKARWLVVFNNTGSSDNFKPKLAIEAPTIGYRKSAAYDQRYYGERCICGQRKGNKHSAQDPELGQGRQTRRKGKQKKKKNSNRKMKLKKGEKSNKNNKKNKKKEKSKKKKNKEKRKIGGKKETNKSIDKRETKRSGKVYKKKKGRKQKSLKSKNRKKKQKKSQRQGAAADVGPQDRIRQVWPWMASITYSNQFTCTGYIISPLLVITTTRCFPDLQDSSGKDTDAVAALNDKKDLIVVVGQDEQGIGVVDPAHYWEEERGVEEIIMNPDCDPVSSPQFCVLALVLAQNFSMAKQERPRPACLNCQVDSYQARVLKGNPFLASYGLQPPQQNARAGTYKAPTFIKNYLSSTCIRRNISTSETYCLKVLGERFMCDVGRVSIGGGTQPGKRDYGALLINRVGRNGYKINFQVVGLLWNFNCGSSGPAEYIPTWPSLAWMVDLMMSRDKPCIKLIRKSDWTRLKTDGYYDNGNLL
eukprot:TRINITY_DN32878_c0_g1_i1.p1 TRINITY_DN32878_c0_g1~~TRINITY_DN32878_c0_g1_i1.p1  ORF type:complete len:846 (+),score=251.22 TRINITY_DN32878_c0_g1_i1:28-2565(+)